MTDLNKLLIRVMQICKFLEMWTLISMGEQLFVSGGVATRGSSKLKKQITVVVGGVADRRIANRPIKLEQSFLLRGPAKAKPNERRRREFRLPNMLRMNKSPIAPRSRIF